MIGPVVAGPLTVRPAIPADAHELAPRLRPWDLVEVLAAGHRPLSALCLPFERRLDNLTWTIHRHRVPIAMAGLTPDPTGAAAVWMLGSEEIDGAGMALLCLTRPWLRAALAEFTPLHNVVPEGHRAAVRWLRWAGFDISHAFVHLRGIRFLHFRMDRKDGPNSAPAP